MHKLLIAIAMSLVFGVLSVYKKWLTLTAALVAALMGILIWMTGEWRLALPVILFFITGSLLGKLPVGRRIQTDAKHSQPRDTVQVLCNGGVAMVCLLSGIFWSSPHWSLLFYMSIAVSTADTWASELGMKFGGRTVDIVGLKPLPVGISGGISWQGSLCGLAGALLIAGCGWLLMPFTAAQIGAIALAGFAGMLVDSVMGSLWQKRYRLASGLLAEYLPEGKMGTKEKGLNWMTNDMVNLVSNVLTVALSWYLQ